MRAKTTAILQSLNKLTEVLDSYRNDSVIAFDDVTVGEFREIFMQSRDSLKESIHTGAFDRLSFSTRRRLYTAVEDTAQEARPNLPLIKLDKVVSEIESLQLSYLLNSLKRNDATKQINRVIAQYDDLENKYNGKLVFIQQLEQIEIDATALLKKVDDSVKDVQVIVEKLERQQVELINIESSAKLREDQIRDAQTAIESRQLSINTFAENIEEYKANITELQQQAKTLLSRESEIDHLIAQAEKALSLRSAEGVSAAFSAQFSVAKKNINIWLFGVLGFLILAGTSTVWILYGWNLPNADSWASIIGRIAAVAIMLTGAGFCSKQYVRQRSIAEDYAYKTVLSKSILAFTDEIKKRNDTQVTEYLTKVLDEMFKDPQRIRVSKNTDPLPIDVNEVVKQVLQKLPLSK